MHAVVEGIWPQMLCAVPQASLTVVALACGLSLAPQNCSTPREMETLILARFHHYSIALRLLKQQIESLNGRPASELLIICVLRMGVSADVEQDPTPPDCHPTSPLATAQYLHLYGRMSLMPSYAKALHYLVESRGGIHALKRIAVPDWLPL
ncbi:hypothetical protein PV04_10136 [Phialophora macrospora]|uniref:Uncharacterized protein n=1 Tax=Phialophora macrospora TaxID=1851006 RepID=A0A0D2F8L2_9EURO|nr:hypothetical protein PV04_10136 [Phialophora macrospora]